MMSILSVTEEHEMFRKTFHKFVENEMVPDYQEWQRIAMSQVHCRKR